MHSTYACRWIKYLWAMRQGPLPPPPPPSAPPAPPPLPPHCPMPRWWPPRPTLSPAPPPQSYAARHQVATPTNIVDMGCSTGISTRWLSQEYPKANIQGLDLSTYFLAVAEMEER